MTVAAGGTLASNGGRVAMPTYQTRYYTIYSDLPLGQVREAELRMTRMAEAYHERTKDFAGSIQQRLPFYLFAHQQDYLDAGGLKDSAGIFDRSSQILMAFVSDNAAETWHVIQHEGFHQFAAAVIGGEIPVWANEGLAEYFGEGIFTGDGLVTGIVPDWRLQRVQREITAGKFRSVKDMMNLSHAAWNEKLSVANYDQAWSMVHFLAHAENGRYQHAFTGFMRDIGNHRTARDAWADNFGGSEGFQAKWRDYWLNLREGASDDAYARATVETLTGALGRAYAAHQRFESLDQLKSALTSGAYRFDPRDWLPSSVFDVALENLTQLEKRGVRFWIASPAKHQPVVLCEMPDGKRLAGQFTLHGGQIEKVSVAAPTASLDALINRPVTSSSSPVPLHPRRP
jgi:hypothetical protein